MRIAQVAPLYESVPPAGYGGTERVVSNLTEALVEQGHDVTLFASGDSTTSARLVPCCDRALRLGGDCIDPIARHVLQVERVLACADEFDIIHWHIDYLHFPVSRRVQVPQVTTLHGRLDLPDLPGLYDEFGEMPVVSISDAQRAPLPRANWVGTVPNAISTSSYRPRLSGTPGEYLAFLGRISREKRPDRAIEIARRVGLPLKIAAKVDAADRAYFETWIRPMLDDPLVEMVGEIGEAEKPEFLREARALLFPIDWPEPFGMVMIEAMACGTPVIAWRHGSVPEVIEDGVSGFIVDDMDSACVAVSRLDQLDRRAVRACFERRFGAEQMARGYLSVYRRVIEQAMVDRVLEPARSSLSAPGGDLIGAA